MEDDQLKIKIAHLNMLQGVISRMATGSFTIKGYVVALLVALLIAFSRESVDKGFSIIIYFPFLLSLLDIYYLRQERVYREVYNRSAKSKESDCNFSMGPSKDDLSSISYWGCSTSVAIWPFYGLLVLLVTVFLCALK